MVKNNKQEMVSYLKKTKTSYRIYNIKDGAEFLSEEAVALGAVCCITVRDVLDLYYNKRGKQIGSATDGRGSFRRRL
jgi:hypothetical protein